MNENNEYNSSNISPYKATRNLNTAIGNPSVNINDPMNVNIQSVATNTVVNTNQNSSGYSHEVNNAPNNIDINTNISSSNNIISNNMNNNTNQIQNQNNNFVKKTYVTADNKPKKKTTKLSLGPEFKIVLLIVVILLVFVFLLPIINDMIIGY